MKQHNFEGKKFKPQNQSPVPNQLQMVEGKKSRDTQSQDEKASKKTFTPESSRAINGDGSPDTLRGIFDLNDDLDHETFIERQRIKAEVEKVLDEFVEDHVPKDTELIDRKINIFVIVAEELKERLGI